MKYFFALLFFIAATSGIAYSQQTPATKIIAGYKIIKPEQVTVPGIATSNPDTPQDLPVTYTFTGNGNWTDSGNWENNLVPPQPTNLGSEIIINNNSMPGSQCFLDIPYTVTPGTSLTILTGKSLVVSSDFIIVN